jgi:hypothetical protein
MPYRLLSRLENIEICFKTGLIPTTNSILGQLIEYAVHYTRVLKEFDR